MTLLQKCLSRVWLQHPKDEIGYAKFNERVAGGRIDIE